MPEQRQRFDPHLRHHNKINRLTFPGAFSVQQRATVIHSGLKLYGSQGAWCFDREDRITIEVVGVFGTIARAYERQCRRGTERRSNKSSLPKSRKRAVAWMASWGRLAFRLPSTSP